MKDNKIFLKKKKSNNMVVNVKKTSTKMKKIKVFQFRKICFFIRESIRNFFLSHLRLKSYLSANKKV